MMIAEREVSSEILATQQLEETSRYLDLEPWIIKRLQQPEREIQVNLQIRRDSGDISMLRASRIQHSSARGPQMGPLVFSKELTVSDARAQAMKFSWQYALWDLPFSGSTGLIGIDLEDWSERELRQIVTGFIQRLFGVLGENSDVISPSRHLPLQVMSWALSAMGKSDRATGASVTGKAPSVGGVDREWIAGRFLHSLIRSAVDGSVSGKQVAIVGFDSFAQQAASELEDAGARVIAVADSSGAVYHRAGLNVALLKQHAAQENVIYGYAEAQPVTFSEMLSIPCDVVILVDAQELRHKPMANLVVEAGGTVAPNQTGETLVIPAILADFGSGFADFLEWRKAQCEILSKFELTRGMHAHIRHTWRTVSNYARLHDLTMEQASMAIALSRVAEAMRMKQ